MKVKATKDLQFYRLKAFENLDKNDYRKLQAGEIVDIDANIVKIYPNVFKKVAEKEKAKDGNR